jgi:hypothetical protein
VKASTRTSVKTDALFMYSQIIEISGKISFQIKRCLFSGNIDLSVGQSTVEVPVYFVRTVELVLRRVFAVVTLVFSTLVKNIVLFCESVFILLRAVCRT